MKEKNKKKIIPPKIYDDLNQANSFQSSSFLENDENISQIINNNSIIKKSKIDKKLSNPIDLKVAIPKIYDMVLFLNKLNETINISSIESFSSININDNYHNAFIGFNNNIYESISHEKNKIENEENQTLFNNKNKKININQLNNDKIQNDYNNLYINDELNQDDNIKINDNNNKNYYNNNFKNNIEKSNIKNNNNDNNVDYRNNYNNLKTNKNINENDMKLNKTNNYNKFKTNKKTNQKNIYNDNNNLNDSSNSKAIRKYIYDISESNSQIDFKNENNQLNENIRFNNDYLEDNKNNKNNIKSKSPKDNEEKVKVYKPPKPKYQIFSLDHNTSFDIIKNTDNINNNSKYNYGNNTISKSNNFALIKSQRNKSFDDGNYNKVIKKKRAKKRKNNPNENNLIQNSQNYYYKKNSIKDKITIKTPTKKSFYINNNFSTKNKKEIESPSSQIIPKYNNKSEDKIIKKKKPQIKTNIGNKNKASNNKKTNLNKSMDIIIKKKNNIDSKLDNSFSTMTLKNNDRKEKNNNMQNIQFNNIRKKNNNNYTQNQNISNLTNESVLLKLKQMKAQLEKSMLSNK